MDCFMPLWRVLEEVQEVLFVARNSILQSANMQEFLEAHENVEAITNNRAPEPLTERQLKLITVSQREVEQDFPLLNGYSLMMLWGALEAWADDLAVTVLTRWEDHAKRLSHRVKLTGQELLEPDACRRLSAYLDAYRRSVGQNGGRPRLEATLELVRMKPGLHDSVVGQIDCSYMIRNLYAHNAGRADHAFAEFMPEIGVGVGDRVPVSTSDFDRYFEAVAQFALDARQRGLAQFGLYWDEGEKAYFSTWETAPDPDELPLS